MTKVNHLSLVYVRHGASLHAEGGGDLVGAEKAPSRLCRCNISSLSAEYSGSRGARNIDTHRFISPPALTVDRCLERGRVSPVRGQVSQEATRPD